MAKDPDIFELKTILEELERKEIMLPYYCQCGMIFQAFFIWSLLPIVKPLIKFLIKIEEEK